MESGGKCGIKCNVMKIQSRLSSICRKYETYFQELYGVQFEMTEAGTKCMAERSMLSSAEARAVFPLVNDLMRSAVTEIEENPQICKIILDSDGKEYCIRYEHGERTAKTVGQKEQHMEKLLCHTVKAKNTGALVRKLCRYYRNTGGDDNMLAQLEAFLNCAIPHLYGGCRKEDFVFASLQKLAGITKRDGDRSGFDNIMRRSFG